MIKSEICHTQVLVRYKSMFYSDILQIYVTKKNLPVNGTNNVIIL